MAGCTVSPAPDRFVSDLLGFLDCQAATLGSQGYLALAAPGSSVSLLLTTLLTIAIALIGYRLLFGDTPGVREGVLTIVKIGMVLALATSWPAYRTVIFDVVLRTPADLAGEIGRPAGLPGASGGIATRMDGADRSLRILAIYGVGVPTREQVEQANGVAPPLFANFDAFALGAARLVFLVGGLGAFALLRLSAGLLLALGPLFAVFLLFAATRGLAEGWLRGLTAATLGAAAVAVALGVELALLEPWLTDLVTQRAARIAIPGAPVALLATATIFTLAIWGLLAMTTRVAFGLRLPTIDWRSVAAPEQHASVIQPLRLSGDAGTRAGEQRSRALAIADSVATAQHRDEQAGSGMTRAALFSGSVSQSTSGTSVANIPLGQSYRRRAARRVSSSAAARDRRS